LSGVAAPASTLGGRDVGDEVVAPAPNALVQTARPNPDKSPGSVDSDDEPLTPILAKPGVGTVKTGSAVELERSLIELQKLSQQSAATGTVIHSSSSHYAPSHAAIGGNLLAAAREQRKRLRRERALLEVDLERWQQDMDNQSRLNSAGKAAGSVRSRELLAEVRIALDTQAQRIAADLREAKSVERILVGQAAVMPDASVPRSARASGSTTTIPVSNDIREGVTELNAGDAELAKVAWEEEALLRRWQAHLGAWPSSFRTAPLSARNSITSAYVDVSRERGIGTGNQKAVSASARASVANAHKALRKRPMSARVERHAWPADSLGTREPLSARGVISGHAAWLRDFHQQLYTHSAYAPGNAAFAPHVR